MQKYLLVLLCLPSFAIAGLYEKIEKAVVDSNLEITRHLVKSSLSQQECEQLILLADSMIEKRKTAYTHNHFRPFLSTETLAWLCGIYACKKLIDVAKYSPFHLINSIFARNHYGLGAGVRSVSLGILAGGVALAGIWQLWKSLSEQATEMATLYNNSLMIKYELEIKLKNLKQS